MYYLAFFISASLLFIAFHLLNTMPKYVKETQSQEEENESVIGTVLPVKGKPLDSEGEEKYFGQKVWLSLMLIISLNVNAQYAGVSVINKGLGVNAGILANKVSVQAAMTFPIMNLENSNTYSLSAGYQFNITNKDEDNYSFTPSIGAALVKTRRWDSKDVMTKYEQMKIMYGAELSKDAFMGRVFIAANYSDALYYGVGMKIFFTR